MGAARSRTRRATAAAALLAAAALAAGCVPAPPSSPPGGLEAEPVPAAQASRGEPDGIAAPRVDAVSRLAREATARVRAVGCERLVTGSGVRVSDDLVLTNRHVVEHAEQVSINSWDGTPGRAREVGVHPEVDVALLAVDQPPEEVVALAEDDPGVGDELLLIGHPGGGRQVLATGPALGYLAPDRLPELEPAGETLRIGALVSPGSSGGPVLDEDGNLAALVFAYEAGAGHALSIPASRLAPLLEQGLDALDPPPGC